MPSQRQDQSTWKEASCFTFALDTQRKRKRARFDKSRKSEVATVRRIGACLRCRLLKASCSQDRPCENCVRAKLSSHVQVHKWMSCVSVALRDVNVFLKVLPSQLPGRVSKKFDVAQILDVPVCLCGENRIVWSLDWLSDHISAWMENRKSLGFSRTGVLASSRLQNLLEPLLGARVCASLRSLVLSTVLAYNLGHGAGLALVKQHRDAFHLARATSAETVLRYLEETLTASFLTRPKIDMSRLQALLIVAFGVMRSLAYIDDTEIRMYQDMPSSGSKASNIYVDTVDMRNQLASTLAHFLILLIDRLGKPTLRDKMPELVENVQKHYVKPYITPLPISAGPSTETTNTTPPAQPAQPAYIPSPLSLAPYPSLAQGWGDSRDGTLDELIRSPCVLEQGDDLQQWLTNDLDTLGTFPDDLSYQWTNPEANKTVKPYRECLLCTSPLRHCDHDALCLACQQPPSEPWQNTAFSSASSSLITLGTSEAAISGLNSLSTSMTSQDSTFDDMMSIRDRRLGSAAAVRAPIPLRIDEVDEEDIFNLDDMEKPGAMGSSGLHDINSLDVDFGGPSRAAAFGASCAGVPDYTVPLGSDLDNDNDEFPPGWSLYWDDSCDEQSVRSEIGEEVDVF